MSRPSTKLSAIGWKLAVLKGLGDGEVAVTLKTAVFSVSTLPKAVAAFVT